ncbi:MAG: thioesterase family protein [Pseudomonadota bacterium]
MHETTIRVRSTQVDQLGHLNNAAFLEIFEWARWEWAEEGGGGFSDMMSGQGLGPVVVRVEVDFRREVRFHDRLRIQTRLESCDRRKGVILQHMIREDGQQAAEARFTFVIIDLAARKVVPMPEEVLELARQA